jgi:hypothetical protein
MLPGVPSGERGQRRGHEQARLRRAPPKPRMQSDISGVMKPKPTISMNTTEKRKGNEALLDCINMLLDDSYEYKKIIII